VTDVVLAIAGVMADETPRDTGPDFGKASPFGLLIVVLLMIATFFLVWSMNKHLRKLPQSFDRQRPEPDQALDEGTVDMEDPGNSGSTHGEQGGQPTS
jgi:hypothetical protein